MAPDKMRVPHILTAALAVLMVVQSLLRLLVKEQYFDVEWSKATLRIARLTAVMAGLVVLGWLAAQVAIIGYVSRMQRMTAIAGVFVLVLTCLLPSPIEPPDKFK